MNTHRYDAYEERHGDDDALHVYQEEIEGHRHFTVSDGAGLKKLATCDIE
jgi:3-deoxy-D-manno-octulosonate 8-phosphate phosphatase KdsC-like HAD superfamily phosphatase